MADKAIDGLPGKAPRFPPGVFPYALVMLLAVGTTVAFYPHIDIVQTGPLKPVHQFALTLLGDQQSVVLVMKLGFLTHIVEGTIAGYLCGKLKIGAVQSLGWLSLVLLFGFPSLRMLIEMRTEASDEGKDTTNAGKKDT